MVVPPPYHYFNPQPTNQPTNQLQAPTTEVFMTPHMTHRVYVTSGGGDGKEAPRKSTVGGSEGWADESALPALTRLTSACYSVGHFLNDATAGCWFSYLLLYMQNAQGLSGVEAGFVLFSGQLADAMATPIVGLLSDRSGGLPALGLGRRKTWNFFGVVIVVVCFFFVFGMCLPCAISSDATNAAKTGVFALFAALFNVGWAAVQVSHMAMVPELTHDDSERVMLNSARYAFTVLANVYVFICMWLILRFWNDGSDANRNAPEAYSLLTYCILGGGGLFSLIFLVGTPEALPTPKFHRLLEEGADVGAAAPLLAPTATAAAAVAPSPSPPTVPAPTPSTVASGGEDTNGSSVARRRTGGGGRKALKHVASLGAARPDVMRWRDWLCMLDFYKVATVYMCIRLATNVSQVYLTFFVTVVLAMNETAIAVVPLLVYLSSLVATMAMKRLDRRLGRRNAMTLGCLLFGAASVIMMFLQPSSDAFIYPAAVLLGAGGAITMVISVSLEADLVGRNVESAAFLYGAVSLTDKLSNGIAILGIQFIGQGIATEDTHKVFIRYVNALVPAASIAAALIVTWTIRFPSHLQGSGGGGSINRTTRPGPTPSQRIRSFFGRGAAATPATGDAPASYSSLLADIPVSR